ncbi:MAG: efflux RND transporter permease subunit [Dermabacter sp.]|nr:efflux RND transporter permease subunit [Dermabacter sp.]
MTEHTSAPSRPEPTPETASKHAGTPSLLLRLVVPLVLVIVWLGVVGVGGPRMGAISEVATNDRALFLPAGAESTRVQDRLEEFQDSDALPAVIVATGADGAQLDPADFEALPEELKKAAPEGTEFSPVIESEDGEAIQLVALLPADVEARDGVDALRGALEKNLPSGVTGYVTGPAGISADLGEAFGGIDGLLLLVAVVAVFIILVIVYRSPLLPILVLLSAMTALVAAALINVELARRGIVLINGQIQGILFILVIGAATDYGLLYTARYREELHRHASTARATWAALRGTFEPILASGGTVIVGLLCLLLSDLGSNAGLGPVAAIGIVMAMLTALTFLPAMLLLLGRAAFWPRIPRAAAETAGADASGNTHRDDESAAAQSGIWARVSHLVQKRPRTVAAAVTVFLIIGCFGLTSLKADGVPQSEFVLGQSDARDGLAVLSDHFPGGSGTPAYVLVPEDKLTEVTGELQDIGGIASLAITSSDAPSGTIPLGEDGAPVAAGPFANATPTVSNGDVLLEATLADSADSMAAERTVEQMREAVAPAGALVGGSTATDLDTNLTSERDRNLIIPIVLAAITIMLALLLRSLVAPLILLATTVLSFGTALGLSAWIFEAVGFTGSDPTVPLYGFIFLVALGIDYNIFLMTRVREESLRYGTREGVHRGLTSTGGVITSAGVVLAATFAALLVIPIQFLVQLAIIVSLGVLIDALIVRSFLVPALAVMIGDKIWWPATVPRPRRSGRARE